MGYFEGGIFHDHGKSAETWIGLKGSSEVDQKNLWKRADWKRPAFSLINLTNLRNIKLIFGISFAEGVFLGIFRAFLKDLGAKPALYL